MLRIRKISLVGLVCVLSLGCAATDGGPDYEVATCALPVGDPRDGRRAFLDLGCATCHRVQGDADLAVPVSAHPGPDLGAASAGQAAGLLVTSIIAPSHHVPDEVRMRTEDGRSPMGDYSDVMTVRQLCDLIAYIRSDTTNG